jgi:hypothetical protein
VVWLVPDEVHGLSEEPTGGHIDSDGLEHEKVGGIDGLSATTSWKDGFFRSWKDRRNEIPGKGTPECLIRAVETIRFVIRGLLLFQKWDFFNTPKIVSFLDLSTVSGYR